MTDRIIDPHRQPDSTVERRLGVPTSGKLRRDQQQAKRRTPSDARVIWTSTLYWYRGAIGGSGDTAYLMRVGIPSGDAAWQMVNLPWPMPAAGRILGVALMSNEARSGGSATARIRITTNGSATDYTPPDCVLNATNTQIVSVRRLWKNAQPFAKAATLEGRILTAGTWAPTSADVALVITVGFEDVI